MPKSIVFLYTSIKGLKMKFKIDIQFTIAPKPVRGINSTIDMKIFSLKTIEKMSFCSDERNKKRA